MEYFIWPILRTFQSTRGESMFSKSQNILTPVYPVLALTVWDFSVCSWHRKAFWFLTKPLPAFWGSWDSLPAGWIFASPLTPSSTCESPSSADFSVICEANECLAWAGKSSRLSFWCTFDFSRLARSTIILSLSPVSKCSF